MSSIVGPINAVESLGENDNCNDCHDNVDVDDNNGWRDDNVSTVKISWGLLGPMGPARVDTGWGDFSR